MDQENRTRTNNCSPLNQPVEDNDISNSWEPAETTSGTASQYGVTQPPQTDSNTANMASWCWAHEQETFMQNTPACCENICASNNNVNYDCEIPNLFGTWNKLATQPGHHPEGIVEGDTPTCYYLDGARDCKHNESQSVRNDALSDFCPEAWKLSPKNMESMFNDFYFNKTVDALSLAAFQASAEQIDVISIPLNNGSATESKADLGNNPYWTTYFNVVWVEESWTEVELREVGCNRQAQDFLVDTMTNDEIELLEPEIVMTTDEAGRSTNGLWHNGSQKCSWKGLLQTTESTMRLWRNQIHSQKEYSAKRSKAKHG